jgi:Fe-S-cluster containining protein
LCCRYFALPIDNPDTRRDYDNIRWYLLHEKVVIFIESGQWYIGILNRCKQLQSDNRCGIYLTRPAICRSYTTDNCDYHAGDYGYDQLFTSAEGLWEYAERELKEHRRQKRLKANRKLKGKSGGKSKSKRKPSLGTRARRLSQTRSLPSDVLAATTKPAVAISNGRTNGKANGRSLALPLF